ncbi:MAG: hypothetical protein BSOLF_1027 [Candidatus Carbobacillus altaicus]|uniref:Uncharacterized protein n=1 Tax=Candidatus Carbonibacillus altaicus TaxID=2163959 RepID=A0A2R6Y055_9BACL|nr:MAG: hypothetical protein BSOLF_1027 [Candidatus Carbobacillus altaicus]
MRTWHKPAFSSGIVCFKVKDRRKNQRQAVLNVQRRKK